MTNEEIIEAWNHCCREYFSGDERHLAFAAIIEAKTLERAAVVCEERCDGEHPESYDDWTNGWIGANLGCAAAIRELKEK